MSGQGALFSGRQVVGTVRAPMSGAEQTVREQAPASARSGRFRQISMQLAMMLTVVGLITVSWDRLLNVQIATYNVKIPSLAFSAAFVLAMVGSSGRARAIVGSGSRRVIALSAAAIVLYETVRAVFTAAPAPAAAQLLAIITGAVLPAATLLLVVRSEADLRRALRWLLAGAVVAAGFGLYQLAAFYAGWPQGITYTGVGIGTGLGRISAFNYEPAYFAYYLVLALGAFITLRLSAHRDVGWWPLVGFAAMLYLANVRAVPLVVLALGLLLLPSWRASKRLLFRGAVVAAATVAMALTVPIAVTAASQAQQQQQAIEQEPRAEATSPSDVVEPPPAPAQALQTGLQTVDPAEQSSNSPRLGLYRAVIAEVQRSPLVGIGPGQLAAALRQNSPAAVQDQAAGQVVANNVWLQALSDGGVPLLLLELGLVVAVLVLALRRRASAAYPMAAAWLAVLGVGGMLTSYFFDTKMWVVLALLLVALTIPGRAADAAEGAV